MNEKITIEQIEKMLWEVTGYKIDQSQVDAFKVLVETLVLEKAGFWKKAPVELVEEHVALLITLARQLVDTGGRMRLDPKGQLDVKENPVATRADVEALGRKIISLDAALQDLQTTSVAAPDSFNPAVLSLAREFGVHPAKLDSLPQWEADLLAGTAAKVLAEPPVLSIDAAETFFEEDEDPAEVFAAFDAGEKFVTEAPVLDDETREAVEQALAPRKRKAAEKKAPVRRRPAAVINPDGTLTCLHCGLPKPTTDYFRNKKSKTGYETKCRACRALAA